MTWAEAMAFLAAAAVNWTTLGGAIVALTYAVLELARRLAPRVRYLVALVGFVSASILPFLAAWPRPVRDPAGAPASGLATWLGDVPLAALAAALLVWLGGAGWRLGAEIRAAVRLKRWERGWRAVPAVVAETRGLAPGLRLRTGRGGAPMAVGGLRPVIYLPAWVWRLDDGELQALVAHEAEHVRWWDPAVHRASRLVLALLWPFRHLHLAYRWVRLEREAAADAAAVATLGRDGERARVSWAELLVAFARPSVPSGVGMASELRERVSRLLGVVPEGRPWRRRARLAGSLALLAAVVSSGLIAPSSWSAPRRVAAPDRAGWTAVDHLLGENPVVRREVVRIRKVVRER